MLIHQQALPGPVPQGPPPLILAAMVCHAFFLCFNFPLLSRPTLNPKNPSGMLFPPMQRRRGCRAGGRTA